MNSNYCEKAKYKKTKSSISVPVYISICVSFLLIVSCAFTSCNSHNNKNENSYTLSDKKSNPSTNTFVPESNTVKNEETTSSNKSDYHNSQYGWRVKIPEEWYKYGIIKEEPNSTDPYWGNFCGQTYFLHKEIHENASGEKYHGWVMKIYAIPKSATEFNQSNGWHNKGGFLGENIDYNFFWEGPTDAQSQPPSGYSKDESDRVQSEYRTLEKAAEAIRDSFKIENEVQNTSKAVSSSDKPIEVRDNDTLSLSGTLATEDYVTNAGDKKTVTILNLDKPIDCYLYADGFYDGKTKYRIESVQLDVTSNLRTTIGNHIAIQGKVMLAHTIHHRRDIIICNVSETSNN